MAGGGSVFFPVLLISFYAIAADQPPPGSSEIFIRGACKVTRYPSVCVSSLSARAAEIGNSRRKLVGAALSVSRDRAESVKQFVLGLQTEQGLDRRSHEAVKDCLEEIDDGLDRLSQSLRELKRLGPVDGPEYTWHMNNVETWLSAALTDDGTCSDGFASGDVDADVRKTTKSRILQVVKLTSNALALVNKMAERNLR